MPLKIDDLFLCTTDIKRPIYWCYCNLCLCFVIYNRKKKPTKKSSQTTTKKYQKVGFLIVSLQIDYIKILGRVLRKFNFVVCCGWISGSLRTGVKLAITFNDTPGLWGFVFITRSAPAQPTTKLMQEKCTGLEMMKIFKGRYW